MFYITGGQGYPKMSLKLKQMGDQNFVQVALSRLKFVRRHHSVCVIANRFLILTGGERSEKRTESFDTLNNSSHEQPDLNIGRYNHASCSLGSSIYVFGGQTSLFEPTGTIEKLV